MSVVARFIFVFTFILCAIAIIGYALKGCNRDNAAIQKIQDSLNVEKALNDTIKIKASRIAYFNDSLTVKHTKDSVKYISKIDSLVKVVQTLKGQFKVTKDSIGTLYGQLKTFYYQHDTVALIATYNRLSSELTEANNQLFAIQLNRDSVDNVNVAEILRLNGLITTLQGQIKQYNDLLTDCTGNASKLAKNGEAALKRAKAGKLFGLLGTGIAALVALLVLIK
jgi:hypothetical protein